jgi:hypothetical protein
MKPVRTALAEYLRFAWPTDPILKVYDNLDSSFTLTTGFWPGRYGPRRLMLIRSLWCLNQTAHSLIVGTSGSVRIVHVGQIWLRLAYVGWLIIAY